MTMSEMKCFPGIMRIKEVVRVTGLSKRTVYTRIEEGLFPCPIRIGLRAVGWPMLEVKAVNEARISGKDDMEIRGIVQEWYSRRGMGK